MGLLCKYSSSGSRILSQWGPGHLQLHMRRGVVYTSPHVAERPHHPTVTHFLHERTRPHAEKVALIDVNTDHSITYGELFRKAFGFARGLRERGFRQGDIYLTFSPNTIESAVAIFGVMAAGGVFTGVNPAFTKGELQRSIELVKPTFFHTTGNIAKQIGDVREMASYIKEVLVTGEAVKDFPSVNDVISSDCSAVSPGADFDLKKDPALILFSSGTTGLPKGVQLSPANAIASVCSSTFPSNWPWTSDDVVLSVFPFFHAGGVIVSLFSFLATCCTTATMSAFNFEVYLKSIEKYKASSLLMPPTLGRQLAASALTDKYDLSTVKHVLTGAAPVGATLAKQISTGLNGAKVDVVYGMSENSCITHGTIGLDCPPGSVGRVIPGIECKIGSLDEGKELPQGSEGEVLMRSDVCMLGYFDNPSATAEAFTADGWYRSGDIGYCDEDGNLFIVDRKKELIKYRGFQVAPAELEDLLLQHDAVADVGVIGVPHESDELVRAYVVRQPGSDVTAEELIKHVADNAVYYKHLRGGVRFIDELPKLASGKILRRVLKDMAVAENAKQSS